MGDAFSSSESSRSTETTLAGVGGAVFDGGAFLLEELGIMPKIALNTVLLC